MDRSRILCPVLALVLVAAACGDQRQGSLEAGGAPSDETSTTEAPTTTTRVNSTSEPVSVTSVIDTEPVGMPSEGDNTPTEVDLSGAGSGDSSPLLVELAADLDTARQQWEAAGISTYHYRGEITHDAQVNPEGFCGLGLPFTAQIVASAVVGATGLNGCLVDADDPGRPPLTMVEWFDFLDRMITGEPDAFLDADTATGLTVFFAETPSDRLIIDGMEEGQEFISP